MTLDWDHADHELIRLTAMQDADATLAEALTLEELLSAELPSHQSEASLESFAVRAAICRKLFAVSDLIPEGLAGEPVLSVARKLHGRVWTIELLEEADRARRDLLRQAREAEAERQKLEREVLGLENQLTILESLLSLMDTLLRRGSAGTGPDGKRVISETLMDRSGQ